MTTLLLLPGAGGDAWYWHRVTPRLRALGHEALAPDLPCADDRAGLEQYATTAAAAAGDRRAVIVVAQSLAAFLAPLLCGRVDVALLVLVAPMIPAPGESAGEWWTGSGQTAARRELDVREGRDPDAVFDVLETFFHDVPQDVVDEALRRGAPRQSDTPFGEPWPLPAWPDVPTRVLAARHDRFFPPDFVRRLEARRPGVEADVIDSGRLPALGRPAELADRLERYRLEARSAVRH